MGNGNVLYIFIGTVVVNFYFKGWDWEMGNVLESAFSYYFRLQSYLVHFANDALTEVEITARHGRVWIRSTESAHSSFLEIHQDSTRSRPWNSTLQFS